MLSKLYSIQSIWQKLITVMLRYSQDALLIIPR